MIAIPMALQWVEENRPLRICSDSSQSSMTLETGTESRDVLIEILQTTFRLQSINAILNKERWFYRLNKCL